MPGGFNTSRLARWKKKRYGDEMTNGKAALWLTTCISDFVDVCNAAPSISRTVGFPGGLSRGTAKAQRSTGGRVGTLKPPAQAARIPPRLLARFCRSRSFPAAKYTQTGQKRGGQGGFQFCARADREWRWRIGRTDDADDLQFTARSGGQRGGNDEGE